MSVRDRLNQKRWQEENQKPESVVSPAPRATPQGGTGSSVRERDERQRTLATPDDFNRPESRHAGMGHAVQYVGSVRQRLTQQEAEKQAQARTPAVTAADYHYAIYKEKQAKEQAARAEERRREAERVAQRKAQQAEAQKSLAVNLIMGDASPAENARIRQLISTKFPEDKYSPERHWRLLQELRAAVGRT
jgi:hypothetical protein